MAASEHEQFTGTIAAIDGVGPSTRSWCRFCGAPWPCDPSEIERLTLLADARGVALAQYREACIEEVNSVEVQCAICLRCWMKDDPERHDTDCILAQPDPDQRGAELLDATDVLLGPEPLVKSGNTVAEHLTLIRAYCRTRIAEPHATGCPLVTYRRLRGATTSATVEPHKNDAISS